MKNKGRLLGSLIVPLLSCALHAQQPPPAPGAIHLNVEVTDKAGKPLAGLTQSDFALLDDKAPQAIASFQATGGGAPVEVVLVIDAINTPSQYVPNVRQEATQFLRANGGELTLPTKLAIYTEQGLQAQKGATKDGNELASVLKGYTIALRPVGRSAGFYGAEERLSDSLKDITAIVASEAQVPGRKLIVVVSPGWPILSGPGIDLTTRQQDGIFNEIVGISRELRDANVTLYAVDGQGASQSVMSRFYYQQFLNGVSKPGQTAQGDLSLQVLATQSGGMVLNSSNDVAAEVQRCLDDGSAYYEISFQPAAAERANEYHSIEVKVGRPGLTVRAPRGYYAQP